MQSSIITLRVCSVTVLSTPPISPLILPPSYRITRFSQSYTVLLILLLHDEHLFQWIDVLLLLLPNRARTFRIGIRPCHGPIYALTRAPENCRDDHMLMLLLGHSEHSRHGIRPANRPAQKAPRLSLVLRVPCLAYREGDHLCLLSDGDGRAMGELIGMGGGWHLRAV